MTPPSKQAEGEEAARTEPIAMEAEAQVVLLVKLKKGGNFKEMEGKVVIGKTISQQNLNKRGKGARQGGSSGGMMHKVTTKKLKGIRRRKWGKWVSEIRVPGTRERLWLGTYATAEAAAVAHDVAVYCLRRPSTLEKLNFPETVTALLSNSYREIIMSPRSVQKVASDVAMDVDARNINNAATQTQTTTHHVITEIKTNAAADDHVHNVVDNNNTNNNSASTVVWWEQGLDDHHDLNCWQGTFDQVIYSDEDTLSISIEDYL